MVKRYSKKAAKKAAPVKKGNSGRKSKDIFEADDEPKVRNMKRRVYGDDDDGAMDSDSEDDGQHPKFRKAKDDESIDEDGSDIGWDSEDELMYGKILEHRNVGGDDKKEDNEDDISDQEEPEEGEMLLSDILSGGKKSSSSLSSAKKRKAEVKSESEEEDEEEDEEEEEEEEEDEFEYDYEDKLDETEQGEDPDEEEGSEDDYEADEGEEDDEDGDLDAVHDRLISAIDQFATKRSDRVDKGKKISKLQQIGENQFSSAAESWGSDELTMDALLGALDGEQSLSVVKQRLGDLEKGMGAPVYVEKVHADRAERIVAYENSSKDMEKWKDTVTANRQAKTLDIANDQRVLPNYKNLVRQFKPETLMEKEIQMVLVKSGATDKAAQDREEDELGKRNLTVAELRQRQAELAKTRALLFYEQMKRRRINKIKSKAYHRIKKRQRVRKGEEERLLAEQDPELLEKLNEDAATQRVRERMNFRHKSTSKFAKNMLKHSHGDKSMREAFNETVDMGKEMMAKIQEDPFAKPGDGESDGGYSDSDEEGSAGGKSTASKVARALRKKGILEDGQEDDAPEVKGKYKKLFEMDFMKKAKNQQRERARVEAQNVLAEIERMEAGSDSDDSDEDAQGAGEKGKQPVDAKALEAAKKDMAQQLKSGVSGFSSMLLKGKKKNFRTLDGSDGECGGGGTAAADDDSDQEGQGNKSKIVKNGKKAAPTPVSEQAENPWLSQSVTQAGKSARAISARRGREDAVYVSLDSLIDQGDKQAVTGKNMRKKAKKAQETTESSAEKSDEEKMTLESKKAPAAAEKKALIERKTQEDIVQMAFAGPDLEVEFATFKDAKINEELGVDKKKKEILQDVKAGWGDWAGPGQEISDKILRIRDRKMKSAEAESELKRKGRRDTKLANVMLSDRRIKTAAKFKIAEIPHPFTSREEYEQSLRMPVGEEWNASHVVRTNTKPEIFMRSGRVVEPIKLGKQHSKPDAPKVSNAAGKDINKKFQARTFKGF